MYDSLRTVFVLSTELLIVVKQLPDFRWDDIRQTLRLSFCTNTERQSEAHDT